MAVGSQGRPRPQIAFTDSAFEAGARGFMVDAPEPETRAAESHPVLVLENCDENGCMMHYEAGEEPRAAQVIRSLPSKHLRIDPE